MSQFNSDMQLLNQNQKFTPNLTFVLILSTILLVVFVVFKYAYISIFLIPTFLIIIFMRTRANSILDISDLSVNRTFSRLREVEGGEIVVTLQITNNDFIETQLIEIIDSIPDAFEMTEGTNIFLIELEANEVISLSYKVRPKEIGVFEFGKITIRQEEFFGFVVRSFHFAFSEPEKLIISPRFERFETLPIYSYWIKFFSGFFISKQFGQDSDFKGIKEYQYGDKLQHINWKTSSKYQGTSSHALYSNVFSFDSVVEFEIILDATFESYAIYTDCLRITASLIEYLLRSKNKVGMTLAGEYPLNMKGKVGARQFKIIIDELLNSKPDIDPSSAMMSQRLINVTDHFSKKAIIFLISTFLNKEVRNFAEDLKNRQFNIIGIQPDHFSEQLEKIEEDKKIQELTQKNPLFYNLITFDLAIDNKITTQKLFTLGIPFLPWKISTPVVSIFNKRKIINK